MLDLIYVYLNRSFISRIIPLFKTADEMWSKSSNILLFNPPKGEENF